MYNDESKDKKAILERQLRLKRGAAIIDGGIDQFRQDGYLNLLNKYGTTQDNSTAYEYAAESSVDDMELTRLYEGNGLFAKIINCPSEEAVKHGLDIDFGSKKISEYIERRLDDLDYEAKFSQAEKMARLYGGSIIVMLADDGGGLEEPLDWNSVRSIEELRVFERAIVEPDYTSLNSWHFMDSMSNRTSFGEPEYYWVYSTYGYFVVHRSRCLVFRNGRMPEHTSNAKYRYWGIPEYVKIRSALRECITAHEDGIKLMERSVQAIYKMKGLSSLLATAQGEDKVLQRLQIIDMARGILNSIAIDNDGEEYAFENFSVTGVKDILDSSDTMLSAVTDIPQTRLFGRSPAGENATGEGDAENFYNMVENIQKENMKKNTRTVIDLILLEGTKTDAIEEIPSYKVKFAPLWSLSDTEQANIEKINAETEQVKAQTHQVYVDMQVYDPSEVRKSLADSEEFDFIEEEDIMDMPNDLLGALADPDDVEQNNTDESDVDAAAIVICKDDKFLVASRRNEEGICGAGGHIEDGETPEDAAKREALEEFNIYTYNLVPLFDLEASEGNWLSTRVYVTGSFIGTPQADNFEMFDARWMPLEELRKEKLFPAFEKALDEYEKQRGQGFNGSS